MTTATVNELDEMVANPVAPTGADGVFVGEVVTLESSAWKLVKGSGRILFDKTYDDPKSCIRGIELVIECEKRDGSTYTIDTGRQPLLEIEAGWHKVLLPSIKKLGVPFSTLLRKFVQVKRIPTGETYVNKESQETKQKTGLQLVAVYDSKEAMSAARDAHFGKGSGGSGAPPVAAAAAPAPIVDRSALEKVLPQLWAAAQKNEAIFRTMYNANPLIAGMFTFEEAVALASIPF